VESEGSHLDYQLVLALRERKPGAFDQVYALHSERIWRFLARLAGPGAEDLFQETWLAAARHAHRLREDTQLLPWLFTIARNKHRNGLRTWVRQSRCAQVFRAQEGSQPAPLDDEIHALRQAARVRAAFGLLPEAHREVLLLCVAEGLATADVALALACSEDVVRKRLSRARKELARLSGCDDIAGEEP
jgi:RNA polymerase sigma factor (sigma-70 family)